MKPEDVLAHPALVLREAQRSAYFSDGFLVLPDYVPAAWLDRLRAATRELLDRSRGVSRSDGIFVLEDGHSADTPRLHRVTSPQDQHREFRSVDVSLICEQHSDGDLCAAVGRLDETLISGP